MLQIMLALMRTGQFIPTGIATDIDTFNRAARGAVSDQVPRMRQQSLLDKKARRGFAVPVFITGIVTHQIVRG
jgi:hypothetical protein